MTLTGTLIALGPLGVILLALGAWLEVYLERRGLSYVWDRITAAGCVFVLLMALLAIML